MLSYRAWKLAEIQLRFTLAELREAKDVQWGKMYAESPQPEWLFYDSLKSMIASVREEQKQHQATPHQAPHLGDRIILWLYKWATGRS